MRLSLLVGCLLLAGSTFAQTPQYSWARLDDTISYTSGTENMQPVVAAHLGKVLWGTIPSRKASVTGAKWFLSVGKGFCRQLAGAAGSAGIEI